MEEGAQLTGRTEIGGSAICANSFREAGYNAHLFRFQPLP
jgi:hypothetical protein